MVLPAFADIHIHPNLKSCYSGHPKPKRNIWEFIDHPMPIGKAARYAFDHSPNVVKYSQTNFYALAEGNVRMPTISLYPQEKGFFDIRNLPKLLTNARSRREMMQVITGYEMDSVQYLSDTMSYFDILQHEYRYVYNSQGQSPDGKYEFKLTDNFEELKKHLAKSNTIVGTLSIEGGHALFDEEMLSGKLTPTEIKKRITENIQIIKSWEVHPFLINLCHHFYNHLAGHSRSLWGLVRKGFLNQNEGINKGLNGLGIKAMKELLSKNNGPRIHVDIKHMSVRSRKELYNWIRSYNYISAGDKIPILASHAGVNGFKTMNASILSPDHEKKSKDHIFNRWAINLSSEEIRIIHETGGLIGLMLDKHKLGGGRFHDQVARIKDKDELRNRYLQLFLDNVFQVIQAINKPSAWDIICIGSDLDGGIEHFEFYDKASTYPVFYQDLIDYLSSTQYNRSLWFGLKPEDMVKKIMHENVFKFYQQHL